MNTGGFHIIGRVLCSFVLLVASSLCGVGSVFCIEADGRILLDAKSAGGGCASCPHERTQHDAEHDHLSQHEEACCTDIEMMEVQSVVPRSSADTAMAAPRLAIASPWVGVVVAETQLPPRPATNSAPPRALQSSDVMARSVVLVV